MIENPWFYPVAILAVLLVGVSKAGFGGATGLMATPLMALFVPPTTAAAIMLPLLIAMDVMALRAYWGRWGMRLLKGLVPGALVGIALGWATFGLLDDAKVALLLGALCIVFAIQALGRQLRPKRAPAPARPFSGPFWGGVAGYTSFVSHAGGPPLTAHMLALGLDKTTFQATTVVFYAVINAAKLPPYAALGLFEPSAWLTSLVLAPAAPAGIWLGIKLHGMVSERWFSRIIIAALVATGIKLIWDALAAGAPGA
jgi:uncharacterized membrane protein YfcA